jgi:hypothetical protein
MRTSVSIVKKEGVKDAVRLRGYGWNGCSILTRRGRKGRRYSRRDLTHSVMHVEHGKPALLLSG